jgi:hypothetical protein
MVNFLPYGKILRGFANKNAKFEIDFEIYLFYAENLCKQKCNFQGGYNVQSSTGSYL